MKKTLLLILMFHFVQFSLAQTKSVDEVDKFTKNKIMQVNVSNSKKWKTSDNVTKGIFNYIFFSFRNINSTQYFQLGINCNDILRCLSKDARLILLFDDESTIDIFNIHGTECSRLTLDGLFMINESQLDNLIQKNLVEFRLYYSEGFQNYKVKEDKIELIKKAALMFKENI